MPFIFARPVTLQRFAECSRWHCTRGKQWCYVSTLISSVRPTQLQLKRHINAVGYLHPPGQLAAPPPLLIRQVSHPRLPYRYYNHYLSEHFARRFFAGSQRPTDEVLPPLYVYLGHIHRFLR